MNPILTERALMQLGIAGKVLAVAIVVGAGFFIYKTISEVKLTNLWIEKLEREKTQK